MLTIIELISIFIVFIFSVLLLSGASIRFKIGSRVYYFSSQRENNE